VRVLGVLKHPNMCIDTKILASFRKKQLRTQNGFGVLTEKTQKKRKEK